MLASVVKIRNLCDIASNPAKILVKYCLTGGLCWQSAERPPSPRPHLPSAPPLPSLAVGPPHAAIAGCLNVVAILGSGQRRLCPSMSGYGSRGGFLSPTKNTQDCSRVSQMWILNEGGVSLGACHCWEETAYDFL